jgi:hypothetical protein
VQPIRTHEKRRRPCTRGHFLVRVADRDHVFFEYLERETSAAVGAALGRVERVLPDFAARKQWLAEHAGDVVAV